MGWVGPEMAEEKGLGDLGPSNREAMGDLEVEEKREAANKTN